MIAWYQDRLIYLLTPFIRYAGRLSYKLRYRLITFCFFIDIVLFCIVRYLLHKNSYFYNTSFGILIMILIAFFSLDKTLVRVNWRRSLWIPWFGFCIALTVSDLFVMKQACGLGILLAVVFTGVFFVWQNHSRRDLLWKCLKNAAKWAFLIMAAVAFFFRPFISGARYAGIFTNPNMFGLYLYVIFAVYMSDLDWSVQRNRPVRKSLLMYVQMALVIFFILLSQARTSTMAAGAILAAWIICRVAVNRKQKTFLPFFKSIGMLIFTAAALFPIFLFGLTHIPTWVGHPIVFQDDVLYLSNGKKIEDIGDRIIKENFPNENVVMEENKKRKDPFEYTIIGRFFKRLDTEDTLNRLSSGRITIYKAYISKQNHLGHKNIALNINGKKVAHAHNNWLQFGYTYGIFAMLFYSIITVLSVWFSCRMYIREFRKKGSYCFLPVAVSVGFFMATLTECLFLPFELFPAFVFWFVFSDLFVKSTPAECR